MNQTKHFFCYSHSDEWVMKMDFFTSVCVCVCLMIKHRCNMEPKRLIKDRENDDDKRVQ